MDHYNTLLLDMDNIKNNEKTTNRKSNIDIKLLNSFLMNEISLMK